MTATGEKQATSRGRVRVERGPKWVRGYLSGELVFSTHSPWLVWEVPYYPAYYVPVEDVCAELIPNGQSDHSPSRGDATIFDVRTPAHTASAAARRYAGSPISEIQDSVRFEWDALDEWLEEDEPVYVHPRDPYTRVDIVASSRHVQVMLDGVLLADSHAPRILYETGLPPR
jgi:uncharacterized protein (DUF427 family)